VPTIGQEGDTRRFRRLRSSDYYDAKAAVQGMRNDPKHFVKCKICGQAITNQNYGGYCMRCFRQ
jgi:translation initiation factor 2 beta subunit (eIF-2beta)/eIF-5